MTSSLYYISGRFISTVTLLHNMYMQAARIPNRYYTLMGPMITRPERFNGQICFVGKSHRKECFVSHYQLTSLNCSWNVLLLWIKPEPNLLYITLCSSDCPTKSKHSYCSYLGQYTGRLHQGHSTGTWAIGAMVVFSVSLGQRPPL